jgi:nicotinate-nucleotide adenylyltransferase
MAIGIFGGSFDPIHIGHLITTRYVLEKRNLEKIIFIPSYISPLKQNTQATANEHRLNMVKLAIDSIPSFEVCDFELKKESVSYTIETIEELKKSYTDIELIIGYDNLLVFEKWFRPDDITKAVNVLVMQREVDFLPQERNRFFDKIILIETPSIEISATEIRDRVKNKLPIDFLVPQKVKDYIYQNELYI